MSKNPLIFRITDLELAKSPLDEKIVGIFRYDQASRHKNGPALLILAEIHSTLYAYERYLDTINAATEQARYLVSQVDQDPLARFEKLVDRLNRASAEFAAQEATPIAWNRINLVVIELSEGQMCLTGVGRLMNIFLQRQEDGGYRSFDIVGSLEQPQVVNPAKPFASVICGEMKAGDVLMLGTSNFERFRSDLRLKERLATLPPVTAALEIKQELEDQHIPDDFVAAIISCIEDKRPEAASVANTPKETSTSSVQKLRETENKAAQHLGPRVAPLEVVRDPKQLAAGVKGFAEKARAMAQSLLARNPAAARHPAERKDPVAMAGLRSMNAGYGSRFTRKHKLMLLGGVAAIAVIGGGWTWWDQRMKQAAEVAAWQALHDRIADLKVRADSDLIYGNEPKAAGEVKEAEDLLTGLATDTQDRRSKVAALELGVRDLRNKLKKVVRLDDAVELGVLPPDAPSDSLSALVLVGNTAYAVDNAKGEALKVDLVGRETKRIPLPSGAGRVVAGAAGKDAILFASEDGDLYAVSRQTDLAKAQTWSRSRSSSVRDIALYAGRLYALDSANGQIWRSVASGGSYGNETGYVKAANTTLNDTVSLAIDSNVYVLKGDGNVIQFTSGGQTGFSLMPADPPLTSGSDIWAELDSTMLAVADTANKRVLLYDKSGGLRAQVQSTQFMRPDEVAVDEANKRVAVIDGNRILLFQLP